MAKNYNNDDFNKAYETYFSTPKNISMGTKIQEDTDYINATTNTAGTINYTSPSASWTSYVTTVTTPVYVPAYFVSNIFDDSPQKEQHQDEDLEINKVMQIGKLWYFFDGFKRIHGGFETEDMANEKLRQIEK